MQVAQFTKKAIMASFIQLLEETPFDKISVVDIADRCGINRNTFYYYYVDIYALVDELFQSETQRILDMEEQFDSWQALFVTIMHFTVENRRAVYHLYNSDCRERLRRFSYDATLQGMRDFVREQASGLDVPDADIEALATFYTIALVGLLFEWLGSGMDRELEGLVNEYGDLLDGNIRYTLERRAEKKQKAALSS